MPRSDHAANVDVNGLREKVDAHMRLHYSTPLADMEMTDTPGYWQDKEAKHHPGHPLHGCLGCAGPFKATYTYRDCTRESGRFVSPYRTWRTLKAAVGKTEPQSPSGGF